MLSAIVLTTNCLAFQNSPSECIVTSNLYTDNTIFSVKESDLLSAKPYHDNSFEGRNNTSVESPVNSDSTLLSTSDLYFLEEMTREVIDASRILPGQKITPDFGGNNTGGTLIRPGGRACYPSFWIRDYAMSLESGFITLEEQLHMLQLTASRQCDQTWITDAGSMVPVGAIADHIRIDDGKPVYFPGTYNYKGQGGKKWGLFPPYCDQYFFVHMAWYYLKQWTKPKFLAEEINGVRWIDRLEMAYKVPPTRQDGVLVSTIEEYRGIDFGFRDVITFTGDLCLPSLLKYRASLEMAELFKLLHRNDKAQFYQDIANRLSYEIPDRFLDARGMLLASTGTGKQADVWSTVLAIHFGVIKGTQRQKSSKFLADAFQKGTLSKRGNIRHVLTCDDFSETTAWEQSLARKNMYQNGALWGTPTGWVCQAIAITDLKAARQLAKEYVDDLRAGDFRKGPDFGAPWECYNEDAPQNAVYMTTVSCPYIVFKNLNFPYIYSSKPDDNGSRRNHLSTNKFK